MLIIVISLGAVGGDDQGEAGGGGGVRGARARGVHLAPVPRPRPQLEPDQELTLGVVIEAAPLPDAAQPPTPLEGDEGDDVLLPELHVVNAHILPRLPAGKLEDAM